MVRLLFLLLVLLTGLTAMAQDTLRVPDPGFIGFKSAGFSFLNYSTSIVANGMGHTGVASIHLASAFANPASIAFSADRSTLVVNKFIKQAGPPETSLNHGLQNLSIIFRQPLTDGDKPSVGFGLGYTGTEYTLPGYISSQSSLLYGTEVDTIPERKNSYHCISAAVAFSKTVDIGVGLNLKFGEGVERGEKIDFAAFDLGLLIRFPIRTLAPDSYQERKLLIEPALGLAWRNYGNDLSSDVGTFTMPRMRNLGFEIDTRYVGLNGKHEWNYFTLAVAAEEEKDLNKEDYDAQTKLGAELALFDAVAVRVGKISPPKSSSDSFYYPSTNGRPNQKTLGLSISSLGIARLLYTWGLLKQSTTENRLLTDELAIVLEYAGYNNSYAYPDYQYLGLRVEMFP